MTAVFPFRIVAALAVSVLSGSYAIAAVNGDQDRKPSLSLKASPTIAFSPARVVLSAELRGGARDYEQYYCPSIEWDWGDGTTSENSEDCEPYQSGKSEIRRRWTVEHVFESSGAFRVIFKLKRNSRVLVAANASVQIRPGFRDPGEH